MLVKLFCVTDAIKCYTVSRKTKFRFNLALLLQQIFEKTIIMHINGKVRKFSLQWYIAFQHGRIMISTVQTLKTALNSMFRNTRANFKACFESTVVLIAPIVALLKWQPTNRLFHAWQCSAWQGSITRAFLAENKIPTLDWPSVSPDLNPTENLQRNHETPAKGELEANPDALFVFFN